MIHVFYSKTTAQALSLPMEACEEELPFMDRWCMTIIEDLWSMKKGLILTNMDTHFRIYLYDYKSIPAEELPELLLTRMRRAFARYAVKKEILDAYFSEGLKFCLGMSRKEALACGRVSEFFTLVRPRPGRGMEAFLKNVKLLNNGAIDVYAGKRNPSVPHQRMVEAFEARYQMKAANHAAFELEAVLEGKDAQAKRTLLVPVDYRFSWLQDILQRAFAWQEGGAYVFCVGEKRILPAGEGEEVPEEAALSAWNTRLKGLLKPGDSFLYRYADGPEVQVQVKSQKNRYSDSFAKCTAAEGQVPGQDAREAGDPSLPPKPDLASINQALEALL